MKTRLVSPAELELVARRRLSFVLCPMLLAIRARLSALKQQRQQERQQFFVSWCSGFHALGFSC